MKFDEFIQEISNLNLKSPVAEIQTEEDCRKRRNYREMIEGLGKRIALPRGWDDTHAQVDKDSVRIAGQTGMPFADFQPLLARAFEEIKKLASASFKIDSLRFDYIYSWTPKSFQEEQDSQEFYLDDMVAQLTARSFNPALTRLEKNPEMHKLEARADEHKLSLKVEGGYRVHLDKLADGLSFKSVRLILSNDDYERLIKNVKLAKTAYQLQSMLKESERNMSIGGMLLGLMQDMLKPEGEQIREMVLPFKVIRMYEDAVGKPLIAAPKESVSKVTELIAHYSPKMIKKGERFRDMQELIAKMQEIDLRIIYDNPVLTKEGAKKLLDQEIKVLSDKLYDKNPFAGVQMLASGGFIYTGEDSRAVERLAQEHFGPEVLKGYGDDDYVKSLERKYGYQPSQVPEEASCFPTSEKALFECFRQSYDRNPDRSVMKYRESYINTARPEFMISGSHRVTKKSELSKATYPGKSQVTAIDLFIREKDDPCLNNYLVINSQGTLHTEDVRLGMTTSIKSPLVMQIQEYLCESLGINFN